MADKNASDNDVPLAPWETATTNADVEESLRALASEEIPEGDDELTDDEGEEDTSDEESDEFDDDGETEDEDGDDDSDDETPEEGDDDLYEVTLPGGEKARVTLDELKKGYSRTQDYTRKTQALAEVRKAVQAEVEGARKVRDEYAAGLEQIETALRALAPKEPDWDTLRRQNPAEYAAQMADFQRHQQDLQAIQQERQRVERERQADFHRQMQAHLAEEREKLVQAVPEWADRTVQERELAEMRRFASEELGFTEEELMQVYDHRLVMLLRDAMRFRRSQQKVTKVKQKVRKVVEPTARDTVPAAQKRTNQANRRARERLARSGRVTDAAAVIMDMLD